jgi:pimeloyl-ACP methyl ester carboxylesterase
VEQEVHLWLPHVAAEEEMTQDELACSVNPDGALYALDVRGLGESLPEERADSGFFQPYGMDYMLHGYGILFGESYLGRRVFDVLRVLDLLVEEGAETVHLYGRGQGAVIALFAAVLDGTIESLTLKNGPLSYHAWVHTPLVAWPSASFLRNALKYFDLPDCIRALKDKVAVVEPWGPDMQPLQGDALKGALKEVELPTSLVPVTQNTLEQSDEAPEGGEEQ